MRVIKILRELLKGAKPEQTKGSHVLTDEEYKWYKVGYIDATSRFETMLDLIEDED